MLERLSTWSATLTLTGPPSVGGGKSIALGSRPAGNPPNRFEAAKQGVARLSNRIAASVSSTSVPRVQPRGAILFTLPSCSSAAIFADAGPTKAFGRLRSIIGLAERRMLALVDQEGTVEFNYHDPRLSGLPVGLHPHRMHGDQALGRPAFGLALRHHRGLGIQRIAGEDRID